MSEFADYLTALMRKKNKNVRMLADYCGMDANDMYQIVRGAELPDSEYYIRRFSEVLQLIPQEVSWLTEKYRMAAAGKEFYQCRRELKEFLRNPFYAGQPEVNYRFLVNSDEKGVVETLDDHTLISALRNALLSEVNEGSGHIRLITDTYLPVYENVVQKVWQRYPDIMVSHLMRLRNGDDAEQRDLYNIRIFRQAFQLTADGNHYHPYYYYDTEEDHSSVFIRYTNYLYTSRQIVAWRSDGRRGVWIKDADAAAHQSQEFDRLVTEKHGCLLKEPDAEERKHICSGALDFVYETTHELPMAKNLSSDTGADGCHVYTLSAFREALQQHMPEIRSGMTDAEQFLSGYRFEENHVVLKYDLSENGRPLNLYIYEDSVLFEFVSLQGEPKYLVMQEPRLVRIFREQAADTDTVKESCYCDEELLKLFDEYVSEVK